MNVTKYKVKLYTEWASKSRTHVTLDGSIDQFVIIIIVIIWMGLLLQADTINKITFGYNNTRDHMDYAWHEGFYIVADAVDANGDVGSLKSRKRYLY